MHRVHTGWAGILLPPCNEASPTPHPHKSRGTHNSCRLPLAPCPNPLAPLAEGINQVATKV